MEQKRQPETAGKVSDSKLEDQAFLLTEEERIAAETSKAQQTIAEERTRAERTIESELFAAEKLRIYEQYVKGKITRGSLDRQVDELIAKKQKSSPVHVAIETPRQPEAEAIVRRYMWWSAAGGLIPFSVIDVLAITTVQVMMLRSLCELYEVPFNQEWGKGLVTALVGSIAPTYLKGFPGFGTLIGIVTGPVFYAASTFAVGKVFTQHFESGGTLLTFEPAKMKEYFREYYEVGRATVRAQTAN